MPVALRFAINIVSRLSSRTDLRDWMQGGNSNYEFAKFSFSIFSIFQESSEEHAESRPVSGGGKQHVR